MYIFKLSIQSLWNRRFASLLTILSIALTVSLLLGVERVRLSAQESFKNTISKTDLIVGARGGSIQLLLYAVFRMGSPTGNIQYETYKGFAERPEVAWTIPYSLGDSYRGFRVVGSDSNFYQHYRYHVDRSLTFSAGQPAKNLYDIVLGSGVAKELNHKIGDQITLSHGVADVSFQNHSDKPFQVVGILSHTATPIDRSVYVTLEGLEAIHADWSDGAAPLAANSTDPLSITDEQLRPKAITAFLIGLKSRTTVLRMQRELNEFGPEPLTAIIPGVALSELWDSIRYAEVSLQIISIFVVIIGMLVMLVSIYNSLNERRREMAILRSIGAGPMLIANLLLFESMLLTLSGILLGTFSTFFLLILGQPLIEREFGLYLPIHRMQTTEWLYLSGMIILGIAIGGVPAWRAYRNTLQDGLTIKV